MAKDNTQDKIADIRTRRNFLTAAAGAIVISGENLLPRKEVQAKMPELEQMAQALHNAVGQYSDEDGPTHVEVCSPLDERSVMFEMEILRPCSVHEIQDLLMPLFGEST